MSSIEEEANEAREAFTRIVEELTLLCRRSSRWTGQFAFTDNPFASGVAHIDGRIEIAYAAWSHPAFRWRTLIHEAIHLLSPAYTKLEYTTWRGWEEGVVEQLQRLLRQEVLKGIDVQVGEEQFIGRDMEHPYNEYILALESVRAMLAMESLEFYVWLLAVPLPERLVAVLSKVSDLPDTQHIHHRRTVMLAQAKLGRG